MSVFKERLLLKVGRAGLVALAILSLLIFLTACPPPRPPAPPVPPAPPPPALEPAKEAPLRLQQGQAAFEARRYSDAEMIFSDFLRRFPGQPGQDLALFRLGRMAQDQDKPREAREHYGDLLKKYPQSEHFLPACFNLARIYLNQDEPVLALARLAGPFHQTLNQEERSLRQQLIAEARFKLNEPTEVLVALAAAWREAPAERQAELKKLLQGFVQAWPEESLKDLGKLYTSPFPSAWILAGRIEKRAQAGDWKAAENLVKELKTRFPEESASLLAGLADLFKQKPKPKVVALGCFVPLSGPLADFGRKLLEGFQLAAGAFDPDSPFELIIEDSAGSAEAARAALERLARREDLLAVMGPLSASLATQAAGWADELKLPLITLTQRRDMAGKSPWAFRDFITPSVLVEAVAAQAVGRMGLKRVVILRPESDYGRVMAEDMAAQVAAQGGVVVRTVAYPPDSADLGPQLKALGGRAPNEPPRTSPLSFQAIFLADGFRQVAQAAPQLAFYDLQPVTLLGTNLWHEPELIDLAGPYVQGAIIPTAFFADSTEPSVRRFVERFKASHGREPDLFAALGFDALDLVVQTIRLLPQPSRESLSAALKGIKDFPGVTGLTSMNDQGEAIKKPYLITVRGKEFVPLETAPLTPESEGGSDSAPTP